MICPGDTNGAAAAGMTTTRSLMMFATFDADEELGGPDVEPDEHAPTAPSTATKAPD
jgi:hypothetical protein